MPISYWSWSLNFMSIWIMTHQLNFISHCPNFSRCTFLRSQKNYFQIHLLLMMCSWWQIEIKIGQAWKCILIFISNWCHLITISHDQGDKICSFMVICIFTPLIIKLIIFLYNVTLFVSQNKHCKIVCYWLNFTSIMIPFRPRMEWKVKICRS